MGKSNFQVTRQIATRRRTTDVPSQSRVQCGCAGVNQTPVPRVSRNSRCQSLFPKRPLRQPSNPIPETRGTKTSSTSPRSIQPARAAPDKRRVKCEEESRVVHRQHTQLISCLPLCLSLPLCRRGRRKSPVQINPSDVRPTDKPTECGLKGGRRGWCLVSKPPVGFSVSRNKPVPTRQKQSIDQRGRSFPLSRRSFLLLLLPPLRKVVIQRKTNRLLT